MKSERRAVRRRVRAGAAVVIMIGLLAAAPSAGHSATAPAPRSMRIAVVLMHLPGSTGEGILKSAAQSVFFSATNSVTEWFREVSSGQVAVTGKVFGYYDSSPAVAMGECEKEPWIAAGRAAAARDGYSQSAYDHIVVVTPADGKCPYAGISVYQGDGVRLDGTLSIGVIVHELGHNLGLAHAGTLSCGTQTIAASCTRNDYGDHEDDMGAGNSHHWSAAHKYAVGWLPGDEVRTVANGSQTIALTASEVAVDGSIELVRVPLPNGMSYVIEKRMPWGTYDKDMFGVWIRLAGPWGTGNMGSDDTQLLDMTPGSPNGFADANLAPGASFVDNANNVTIKTIADPLYGPATVQVCIGPCSATTAPIIVGVLSGSAVVLGTSGADQIRATAVTSTVVDISTYGTAINATSGCVLVWNGHAWCTATYADINGGAGNDLLILEGALRGRLQGHYGDDTLIGSTGADIFYGGPGFDTVDYSARVGQTITGTPGTGYDDGQPGEGDNIMADVERVVLP